MRNAEPFRTSDEECNRGTISSKIAKNKTGGVGQKTVGSRNANNMVIATVFTIIDKYNIAAMHLFPDNKSFVLKAKIGG